MVISFGPEHAPLEQRQVELAWEEARTLSPRPGILVFAAFQFDPEAAKDIDELTREKTGMTFLKVQMNPDLLTEDLKKKRASNESFWLMGQPDVEVRTVAKGEHKGKLRGRGARLRLLQHQDRPDRVGRHPAHRPLDARSRLRRPEPLPAPGVLPDGRRERAAGPAWPATSRPRSTRSGSRPIAARCRCPSSRAPTSGWPSRSSTTAASRASRSSRWHDAGRRIDDPSRAPRRVLPAAPHPPAGLVRVGPARRLHARERCRRAGRVRAGQRTGLRLLSQIEDELSRPARPARWI